VFRFSRLQAATALAVATVIPAVLAATSPEAAGAVPHSAQRQQQPAGGVGYTPPVAAPVVDPFRAPATPYGPGNRGLTYDTHAGDLVRAAGDGTVVFAGRVGTSLHVTVLHADGVRTSYSFLRRIDVAKGRVVRRGDPVGTAGDSFHLGARRGDAYFDPASLFAGGAGGVDSAGGDVELLPLEIPPGLGPRDERAALLVLTYGHGGGIGLGMDMPDPGTTGDVLRRGIELAELGPRLQLSLNPVARSLLVARDLAERLASREPCSDGPPPTRPAAGSGTGSGAGRRRKRRALLVGGLGSTSASASIDELRVDDLGYGDHDVDRFSYTDQGEPYGSGDTQGDLVASGKRLADAVEAALRRHPGETLDLYGHSMGGVVVRLALAELDRRGVDLRRLGVVVTLGTPHEGASLATAVSAARLTLGGTLGLDVAEDVVGTGLSPDATAIAELAETSDLVDRLRAAPVPDGVDLVSIAADGDFVVAAPNTRVDHARNVTVDVAGRSAHSDLVAADETTDEIARALAGQDPGCESPAEIVKEEAMGHGIAFLEDAAGFSALDALG
jgi:hypothetical protein